MAFHAPSLRHVLPGALLGLLLGGHAQAAQTVYRSIGADGSVSFSDTPPATGSATRLSIEVSETVDSAQEQARLQALRETTDRMVANREAREKHRLTVRRLRAESAALAAAQATASPGYPDAVQTRYLTYPAHIRPRYSHDRGRGKRHNAHLRQPSLSEQLAARTRANPPPRKASIPRQR